VGGKSFLPQEIEWPMNPDDYFLDSIVYHGDKEELGEEIQELKWKDIKSSGLGHYLFPRTFAKK